MTKICLSQILSELLKNVQNIFNPLNNLFTSRRSFPIFDENKSTIVELGFNASFGISDAE